MVINYIKESTQNHSVFMNMKEGVEGGKLRGSYQGKEAGGNPGRVQGLLCALTRPETPEDTSLAEPQSRSGAEGGRRAELGKLSMLEGQEGPDAIGND